MSVFSSRRGAIASRRPKTTLGTRTKRTQRQFALEPLESRVVLSYTFTYVAPLATATGSAAVDSLVIAPIGGFLEHSVNGGAFDPNWGGFMVPADISQTVDVSLSTGDGSSFQLGGAGGGPASESFALFDVNIPAANTLDTALIDDSGGAPGTPATYTLDTGTGPNYPITGPGINYSEPVGIFNGGVTLQGSAADGDIYNVLSAFPNEPVNVVSGASIDNIVNVGSDPGTPSLSTVSAIQSLVTVSDPPGLATLNILDAGDTASGDADVETGTVTGLGFPGGGSVSYAGGIVGGITDLNVDGGTNGGAGITYTVGGTSAVTTLNTGPNDDGVNVFATAADAPLTINGNDGADVVNIGLGDVTNILGDVTVTNVFDFTALTVDASGDFFNHDFTLSSSGADSTLVGLAPATIDYHTGDVSALTIDTSDFGSQVMNIDMSGGNPIPVLDTPGLVFNAGGDATSGFNTHALNIFGELPSGPFSTETHNANDQTVFPQVGQYGSIDFTDSLGTDTSLNYTGLTPITDTTPAITYTFNDFGFPDQSFSTTDGPVITGFQTLEFANTPTPPTPTNFETTDIANKNFVTFNTPPAIPGVAGLGLIGTVNVTLPSDGLLSLTFNTFTGGDNSVSFVNTPPGVVTSLFGGAGPDVTDVTGLGVADGTVLFLNGGPAPNTLNYDAGGEDPTVTPGLLPGEVLITIPGSGVVDAINYQQINITDETPLVITPGPAVTINSVEGFNYVDALVGTFTVPIPVLAPPGGLPASDFTASIDWGDPSPDPAAGTITQDASDPSVYYITGTHTFVENGTFTVANTVALSGGTVTTSVNGTPVSITFGPAGPTAGTDATANVTQGTLAVSAFPIVGTEGLPIAAAPIATFIDAGGAEPVADYSATIIIIDSSGAPVAGTPVPATSITQQGNSAQYFVDAPALTLPEEGTYSVRVVVTDTGGATPVTAAGWSLAVIADAPLTAGTITTTPATVNTGVPFSATGTFTDANPTAPITDFTDAIDWGDGSPNSVGIITQPGGVGTVFDVTANHIYAAAGDYTITITVHDVGGSVAVITGPATVTDLPVTPLPPAVSGNNFTAVEGQSTGTIVLATFTDPNTLATVADLTATLPGVSLALPDGGWGDMTPGADVTLAIQEIGGTAAGTIFEVLGSHTFAEEGTFTVTINVTTLGGAVTTFTGTATVIDARLTGSAGTEITGLEGNSTGTVLLGTFVDANQAATVADYTTGTGSVVVAWGDGSAPQTLAAGNLTPIGTANGVEWTINAAHTYPEEGTYAYTVTVTDAGGAATIVSGSAIIADAPLSATEGQPIVDTTQSPIYPVPEFGKPIFTGAVATFTDGNPTAPLSDFTATIDWGDGTPQSAGTVSETEIENDPSFTEFTVTGSHTYADAGADGVTGTYPITVYIVDSGGSRLTVTNTANVADIPITLTGILNPASVSGKATSTEFATNVTQPNFYGTSEAFSEVTITATPVGGGTPVVTQAQAGSGGAWSITSNSLAAGTYTITASAVDQFGETMAAPVTIVGSAKPLVVDTVAPTITALSFDRFDGTLTVTFQDDLSGMDLRSITNSAFYHITAKPLSSTVHPPRLILPTSISYTPGALPSDPVVVNVVFNNGHSMRGGNYGVIINSGSGDQGIQDVAGNALDGNFYGVFPSGDGLPGGNFVATIATFHDVVKPAVPILDGYVPPAAGVDPPAGSSHVATTHKPKTGHTTKPKVIVVNHPKTEKTRVHDAALKSLVSEKHRRLGHD